MIRFLILLSIILCSLDASSQTYSGHVADKRGKALGNVTVMLLDSIDGKIGKTRTDSDGRFSIKAPGSGKAAKVRFSMAGLAERTLPVDSIAGGRTVRMDEKTIELEGVTVKADKIIEKGDTLAYLVAGFREKHDRSIEDVLRHMPGIEVSKDGVISYNGKKIENFYIEGENLVGSKYGIASKNLSAYKVKKVEVLRNHQKIKALRKRVFSEEASLNIVLEEDAKNRWEGNVEVAAGAAVQGKAKALHSGKLLEMFFAHKMQTISMYKHDNSGQNIFSEVSSMMPAEIMDSSPIGSVNAFLLGGRD